MEEQDLRQINLKKSEDELLENLLNEALDHKSENSVNMIKEIMGDKNIPEVIKKNKKDIETFKEPEVDEYYDDELMSEEDAPFDLVSLPSKGLIYKNGKAKIPVSYLTASDEDMITSPNLYLDGKVIDLLLRKKILDKNIKPELLCKGDRDAVIVWLRASSYGSNFPVTVKDPISGEKFETEVDLSEININEFKLIPDEDGLFTYKLPKTGHTVKFRFMTYSDDKNYSKLLEKSNPKVKKHVLSEAKSSLENILNADDKVDSKLKLNLNKAIENIEEYINTINDDDSKYIKSVTYILEKSIVSIDGNSNKNFIKKYISQMPALDSISFRRYINVNTPSLNYKVSVQRPESLGGGSFNTFLELDDTIFINIPEF